VRFLFDASFGRRKRAAIRRLDAEITALRCRAGGYALASYASIGFNPEALGGIIGTLARLSRMERHRRRIAAL
jgi:hypothetical protein